MVMKGHYEFTFTIIRLYKDYMSINFTCFNLEGGDRAIKDTKY